MDSTQTEQSFRSSRSDAGGQTGQRFSQTVNRLRSELDRLTEMAWARGEEVWGQLRQPEGDCDWSPEVDVVETDKQVIVFVNLPGLSAQQVEITLIGNTLELSGQVDSLTLQTSDRVQRRERPTGKIGRTITLPVAVDQDSATARAEHGVLKIEMTKVEHKQAHKVRVVDDSSGESQHAEY